MSMRPSALRKSKSQDTHDRRPVEGALTTEGVHRDINIDSYNRKGPQKLSDASFIKTGFRKETAKRSTATTPTSSSPSTPQPLDPAGNKVIHDSTARRPGPSQPISIPGASFSSGPSTPTIGKGHAHDPLEDTLFLNIGTGEDYQPTHEDSYVVSESPSNVDMDVYETAYEEEVQRIIAQRKDQYQNRRPTLYLTRRVENLNSIRDNDCIFDEGQDLRRDLKIGFKSFVQKTKEDIEARGELQKLQEGKEGRLSRTMRNVREAKRLVEEARERIKIEDREKERERERSRSVTPLNRMGSSGSVLSRSGTPVAVEK